MVIRIALVLTFLMLSAGVAAASSADPSVVINRAAPHANRVFTGVFIRFHDRQPQHTVTCDAKLGGRVVHVNGGLAFKGGRRLAPIIRMRYAEPTPGAAYVRVASCGWRIPAGATGKLLSLLPPPNYIPCDVDCPDWGVVVDHSTFVNQKTWRVKPG